MTTTQHQFVTLALAAFLVQGVCTADTAALKLDTRRAIIFKDGYYLVVKEGTATSNADGEIFCDDVPEAAVLGSFWAASEDGRLISMTAGWSETTNSVTADVSCVNNIELLQANKGRTCEVSFVDGTEFRGVIREVLTRDTTVPVDPSLRATMNLGGLFADPAATASAITGTRFVLRTEEGDVMLSAASIRALVIPEMATTIGRTVTKVSRAKRLTFRFEEPRRKHKVVLMYFRPGMRWIPTYRINLAEGDKKVARLEMQAELLNEAEDLVDVPVDIVVGVPNFRFRTTISPLILERTLRNALQEAAPQLMGQTRGQFSNASYALRSGERQRAAAQGSHVGRGGEVELPNELTASGAQDLFIYSLPPVRLRKGERSAVQILTAEAPYRDVYTWDIRVKRQGHPLAPSAAGLQSPLALEQNQVWHQIELTNASALPWTTGAAMVMQGRQPIAQELLTYTSPTEVVRIPLTVSVDARGTYEGSEVGRQLKDLVWLGHHYARIDEKLELGLCNHKTIPIDVEIACTFGGKVDDASHKGKTTANPWSASDWSHYRGDQVVNNSSTVRWTRRLDPGEVFAPTIEYHFYARH